MFSLLNGSYIIVICRKFIEMDELLEKARTEIEKIRRPQPPIDTNTLFDNAMIFADNVLKRLVAHTLNKKVEDLFEDCFDTRGFILIQKGDQQFKMSLDLVDKSYMLDLGCLSNSPEVKDHMVFLLNTVRLLFPAIRDTHLTADCELHLDVNTTLYIDKDSDKRLGILIQAR
jgi:hypothetical protein